VQTTTTVDSSNEASEFINLVAKDWEGTRRAHLDEVHRGTTVGEVVSESARALQLPFQNFYQALFRGRELNHGDTLEEAGVVTDGEIELVPEVSAGSGPTAARS
jgi:hypothetical protein